MRLIIAILFTGFAIQVHSQVDRKFVRRGNRDFDKKQFQQAEIQYRKALEKNSKSEAADFNLGNALYKQNQFDVAASRYAALTEQQKDKQSLSRQFYNLGNALFKSGKYKESIEAYKQSLRQNPNDLDAKHNLQLAMKKLEAENQKKNQNKQNDQNNKDNHQQDRQQNQQKDQNSDNKEKDNNQKQNSTGNDDQKEPRNQQGSKGQISPEDAERILQALENEEKNVLKKVQEQQKKVQKVPVEKNW